MTQERSESRGTLAIVGIAVFAALCCAAPVVAATLGLGAMAALFTSLWLLAPTALIAAGVVGWHTWRRFHQSERVEDETSEPARRPT